MRRTINGLFLALSLSLGASAFAANERRHKPSEYQEITDEDRTAAREKARSRVSSWRETELPPEYEFPWMQIGFVALAFVVATPFAIGAYNRHAAEVRAIAEASNTSPRKRVKAAPAEE
ncbi:MAG: hypothetical protein Q8K32_09505 [Archangium sp.]|nr:hypothetical protein [Archangium sp.]